MEQETKRQKQVAGEIQSVLNKAFQHLGLTMMDGGMVSISSVKLTPDLLEARIYISLFKVPDPKAAMKRLEDRAWEIKKELAASIKHQVRRIPELQFYYDDTLDYVFKMEEVFDKIKKEDAPGDEATGDTTPDKSTPAE